MLAEFGASDRAEQKKRAEVEERYMAEAEKSVRPKSSKVWEHFTLNKQKKCVNVKIRKSDMAWHGSTAAMIQHLKRKHGVFDEEEGSSTAG